MPGIRQFIIDKKIVSLKARDNLKVIPTPPFMRGHLFGGGLPFGAPPLDPNGRGAVLGDAHRSEDARRSRPSRKLREYNNWALKWLTIHEALPGHYVQAEHANEIQPADAAAGHGRFMAMARTWRAGRSTLRR